MDASQIASNLPDVFIEAGPLGDPWLTGIGRYTARLALALAEFTRVRFFCDVYELRADARLDWSHDQDLRNWAHQVWRGRRMPLSEQLSDCLAVYPCLRPDLRRFGTEVSILHDFTPLVVPHAHTERTRGLFQGFYAKTLLSSDWALSVSHATKFDASYLCDFPQERIAVCHSGPSMCVERHLHEAPMARRPNVGLVVATLEPRKNADFLLEWFRTTSVLPEGAELWWVGHVGWLTSRRRLKSYHHMNGRRIRFLGTVSDRALCRLYRQAGWSIYPSLYEGFGFPVLDALRHGVPVLMGYHSALREFEGLAGVGYFDPCDAASLDEAWRQFEHDRPSPAPLDELDRHYNWRHVAKTILHLGANGIATAASDIERAA